MRVLSETEKNNITELWDELGNIPVNDDLDIEQPFLNFEIGTNAYDIWHWFEEKFNISLGEMFT
jgi:hypothetical protein